MDREPKANKKALKFVLFVILIILCWYLGRVFKLDFTTIQDFLSKYPLSISGLIFVLVYVGTTTFLWFGPKDVLRIVSAVLFGAYVSTIFVWIAEMINACIMFHLSRSLGRGYVQQKFRVNSQQLDKMKEDISILGIIAWRINILIPIRMMDLGFGLTRISFRKYALTIAVITFFRILWQMLILEGVGSSVIYDIQVAVNYFLNNRFVFLYCILYVLAMVIITCAALFSKYLKKRRNS